MGLGTGLKRVSRELEGERLRAAGRAHHEGQLHRLTGSINFIGFEIDCGKKGENFSEGRWDGMLRSFQIDSYSAVPILEGEVADVMEGGIRHGGRREDTAGSQEAVVIHFLQQSSGVEWAAFPPVQEIAKLYAHILLVSVGEMEPRPDRFRSGSLRCHAGRSSTRPREGRRSRCGRG